MPDPRFMAVIEHKNFTHRCYVNPFQPLELRDIKFSGGGLGSKTLSSIEAVREPVDHSSHATYPENVIEQ